MSEKRERAAELAAQIVSEIGRTVVGQDVLRRRLVAALITGGHILLEGVPGLAKTLSIRALASAVQGSFQRIQFTPDLLPADLIGTEIFLNGKFEVRKGPVFANFVLADEINRAPAKVQSALLETMQERQVTIGRESFAVPDPFLVLATQNPIEQEGTYPLPEAQLDRFLMKVRVTYPAPSEEREVLERVTGAAALAQAPTRAVATLGHLAELRLGAEEIYVDERLKGYIVDLVTATRNPADHGLRDLQPLIELGASPRSTIALFLAARAEALIAGSDFVSPQHVKEVAHDVLRHRVILSYEAEAEGRNVEDVITQLLNGVRVP